MFAMWLLPIHKYVRKHYGNFLSAAILYFLKSGHMSQMAPQ